MNNTSKSFIVAVLLVMISLASSLQCYSCQSRENEACGRNPTEANRITCAINKFCIVKRTERTDSTGRNVTILRGCRQSAMLSAVSSGGNQVGISVSSQSCSTDLCNTGNGLIGPNNNLLPGFNISNSNINFGFINNHFDFFNHFKKVLNQTFSRQSPSVVSEAKRMVLKDLNVPTSLKMFGVIIPQQQPSDDGDNLKRSVGGIAIRQDRLP
ncbi:uncharacterized protein LOC124193779 isoform X1 [Daphnia pulex]|uniref:uncharacterized protein LOC124193779 isoform X1 n=1 Tax=Daphnia pulex TaxID=6669 RepID=UPI001EDFF98A|nr:uncharacterized protein LOC124193779 isoform X1 [Daphnia pulex]